MSLVLRWVSCKQHIEGSCFCIHSASLCLLVGAFNPFTFKVIIDKYDPVTIYFIVLGSGLYTLFANTDFLKGKGEPSVSACLGFMFWLYDCGPSAAVKVVFFFYDINIFYRSTFKNKFCS